MLITILFKRYFNKCFFNIKSSSTLSLKLGQLCISSYMVQFLIDVGLCPHILTVARLRNRVIWSVNYFPRTSLLSSRSLIRPCRKKNGGKLDVLKRVLRRHSCPIRPYTSYAFFVMATWGFAKSSSFGETSEQLGRMWCQLPQKEKRFAISRSLGLSRTIQFSQISLVRRKRDN